MKTKPTHHPVGNATDRTQTHPLRRRMLAVISALALTVTWVCLPDIPAAAETAAVPYIEENRDGERPILAGEEADRTVADSGEESEAYPHSPVSTAPMARSAEPSPSPVSALRSVYRPLYPFPGGSMAVTLYLDGREVLKGHAVDIGGVVFVPVQRFADLFGSFTTVYTEATEQVVITGTNLSVTVRVGDPYITVNDRIFYTGAGVRSLGGWIFVPLTAMCKAMGAHVNIRRGYYDAFITSGNPAAVARAAQVYDSTDLYWLSRIISAEAQGEPLEGQIAVGNVVMNRVRSHQFPNTVKEVVFDRKYGTQFAPVDNGTVYQSPTPSAIRAAKICLEGYSLSSRILYFFNPHMASSTWIERNRPYVMTIGNHKFYG